MAIKNGKQYQSKAAAYQILIRPEIKKWDATGSVVIDTVPPLTAEFAKHLGEFGFTNPMTGGQDTAADIRGHFFDSAQQAEEKGWSQEEHDLVVRVVDGVCAQQPEYVWEWVQQHAPKPWPTYDEVHHKSIPGLAEQLGLVAEALAYEEQTKNRREVVEKLVDILDAAADADAAEDALTAA